MLQEDCFNPQALIGSTKDILDLVLLAAAPPFVFKSLSLSLYYTDWLKTAQGFYFGLVVVVVVLFRVFFAQLFGRTLFHRTKRLWERVCFAAVCTSDVIYCTCLICLLVALMFDPTSGPF